MSQSAPEKEGLVGSSLYHLSTECLDFIAGYLTFSELTHLLRIGHPVLTSKLEQGVTNIDAKVPCLSTWSHAAFRHRRLHSLTLKYSTKGCSTPFYAPNDRLIPIEGHATLKQLSVRSPLGLTLLRDVAGEPPLSALLPSLEKLHIHTTGRFQPYMLRNVPATVLDLAVTLRHPSNYSNSDITILQGLPKRLESLKLQNLGLTIGRSDDKVLKSLSLPPGLTSLDLEIDYLSPLLAILPKTVRVLSLLVAAAEVQEMTTSTLPPELESLAIYRADEFVLIPDAPFPRTLTELELPLWGFTMMPSTLPNLWPSSLTAISLQDADKYCDLLSFPKLAILQHESVEGSSLEHLTSLTELTLSKTQENNSLPKLPSSLKSFKLSLPTGIESIERMINLTALRTLVLTSPAATLPSNTFWTHMHSRLESLTAPISTFASHKDIFGPWKRLTNLTIGVAPQVPADAKAFFDMRGGALCYFRDNPVKLPTSLTSLTLTLNSYHFIFWQSLPSLTRLESLTLSMADSTAKVDPELYSIFLSLPASLRVFEVDFYLLMPPKCLASLPPLLQELRLSYKRTYTPPNPNFSTAWTAEHIKHLPPRLVLLEVTGVASVTLGELEPLFPPTLVYLTFGEYGRQPATTASKELKRQTTLI